MLKQLKFVFKLVSIYLQIAIRKFASESFVSVSKRREVTCVRRWLYVYASWNGTHQSCMPRISSRMIACMWKCRCVAKAICVNKFRVIQIYPPLFPNEWNSNHRIPRVSASISYTVQSCTEFKYIFPLI